MKFASPEIFKKQVVRYAVIAGYSIKFSKSEKVKIAAKGKEGCVWRIYASWDGPKESFVVKSLNPNHTCNKQDCENIQAKPRWLAEEYLEEYRKDPNWSRKALQQSVMERFGVRIQRFTCYNVRKQALGISFA
ncbi:unnamed protein product [Cuscuta europaea]|uniref:Transposase MuDR plant domain-containing protein n=1 Tax=Cuscuta europaea TaxID=41803 RepID=A0A9P0ZI22_CUSEU|nr:unnamed protein product [Cuscuta europaea]